MPDGDAPTVRLAVPARRRRWPLVVGVVAVTIAALVGVAVLAVRADPPPQAAAVAAASPAVVPTVAAAAATPSTTTSPNRNGCPDADTLVAVYRRAGTSAGRSGAVGKSLVTCSAGFAVLKVHSPGDAENVSAIFAVGPPIRFLEAGSGPVCTDDRDSLPGSVVVPRSSARALGCSTTGGTTTAPTLGSVWASNQTGFGGVRPTEINAGGDSTGIVEDITWSTWGGATARGRGTGHWIGPDQASYQATLAPAVVIVDELGTCQGHPAYLRVRWYFPTHGESAPAPDTGFASICGG